VASLFLLSSARAFIANLSEGNLLYLPDLVLLLSNFLYLIDLPLLSFLEPYTANPKQFYFLSSLSLLLPLALYSIRTY
jgi:hypothetical protein